MISEHIPSDSISELENWKKLYFKNSDSRLSSFTDHDSRSKEFKKNFNLSFVLFNLLNIKDVDLLNDKYTVISRNYLIENIIQSLVATDNNLYTLASMEYRSAIESALRFALAIENIMLKEKKAELWKNGTPDSKIILASKTIKSKLDTHKIGAFTNFSKIYFKNSPINISVDKVLDIYSLLSNKVHTNDFENTHFVKYLLDIYNFDSETINSQVRIFNQVLTHIFVICYLSINKKLKTELIGTQTEYFLEANSNTDNLFKLLEIET